MQLTTTQIFHHRWAAALAAQDVAALRDLYHPDAVHLSVGNGQTLVGADAIASGFAELFDVVGAITVTSVESLIDAGGAYVAETVQSSRFAQARSYDAFVLDNGRALFHVTGSVNPRPPAVTPRGSYSPGQVLHRRYWEACDRRDIAAVGDLYAPEAVAVELDTVVHGRQMILQNLQQAWQQGVITRLKSLSAFVEGPDVFASEGVLTLTVYDTPLDIEFYDVWILSAGRVGFNFTGFINPGLADVKQWMQKLADIRIRAIQSSGEAQVRAMQSITDVVTGRTWRW